MSSSAFSSRYRTAFITGASTGLGGAFTRMLLAAGVEVWGTSRDPARLQLDHAKFHPVALELGDGPAAERVFLEAEKAADGFDIVINNAAFGAFGAYAHTDFAVWEEQFRVMLVNTARLSQAALRGMLARNRGALVNISSIAGEFGMPYQAVYNATKAGLSALNESLMYEVKSTGVIVIDFRPGDYRTDFEGSVRRPPGRDRPWPGERLGRLHRDDAVGSVAGGGRHGLVPRPVARTQRHRALRTVLPGGAGDPPRPVRFAAREAALSRKIFRPMNHEARKEARTISAEPAISLGDSAWRPPAPCAVNPVFI